MPNLTISLASFEQEELLFLKYHLEYAAVRLCYYHTDGLGDFACPPTLEQLAEMIRDQRYFAELARAVTKALDQPRPSLDLGCLLNGSRPYILTTFLARELARSREAISYLQAQPGDPLATVDVLKSLEVESRFLELLLNVALTIQQPALSPIPDSEPMLPLLFLSLPRTPVVGTRRIPRVPSFNKLKGESPLLS